MWSLSFRFTKKTFSTNFRSVPYVPHAPLAILISFRFFHLSSEGSQINKLKRMPVTKIIYRSADYSPMSEACLTDWYIDKALDLN
jgi:hypothetical protein